MTRSVKSLWSNRAADDEAMPGEFLERIRQSQNTTSAYPIMVGKDSVSGKRLHVKRGERAKYVPLRIPISMPQTRGVTRAATCVRERISIFFPSEWAGIGQAAL